MRRNPVAMYLVFLICIFVLSGCHAAIMDDATVSKNIDLGGGICIHHTVTPMGPTQPLHTESIPTDPTLTEIAPTDTISPEMIETPVLSEKEEKEMKQAYIALVAQTRECTMENEEKIGDPIFCYSKEHSVGIGRAYSGLAKLLHL